MDIKKQITLSGLFFLLATFCTAQNEYWAGFAQQLAVKEYAGLPYKLSVAVKLEADMKEAKANVWARTHRADETMLDGDMIELPSNKVNQGWQLLTIEDTLEQAAAIMFVGGRCDYNGRFYYDDFQLQVLKEGKWINILLNNGDFENTNFTKWTFKGKTYDKPMIEGWGGFIAMDNRATFTPIAVSVDAYQGKSALLIEGKGYLYAPALLKKYVGTWDVEFIPSKSENTLPGAIVKGVCDAKLISDGYVLQEQFYGRAVFKEEEDFFNDFSQISMHPDLGKTYAIETGGEGPPGIYEGKLALNGNLTFIALTASAASTAENRRFSYTWINEDEYAITHQFDLPNLSTVKMYYRVTRRK